MLEIYRLRGGLVITKIKSQLKKGSKIYRFASNILHNYQSAKRLILERIGFELGGVIRCLGLDKEYAELAKYKDIFKGKGKRAFVVATGPSLTTDDLDKLKNEITFSMNGIFQMYEKTEWRPTYYGILDIFVYQRFIENDIKFDFDNIVTEHAFVDSSMKIELLKNQESLKNVSFVPVYRFNHYIDFESRHFGFSRNLLKGHYSTWTVTNFAINMAAYMGIEEIYLLGVDCSYTGKKQYANGVIDPKAMSHDAAYRTQQKMIDSYKYIKKRLDACGVHVYNATRGGELEVFERRNFDDLF